MAEEEDKDLLEEEDDPLGLGITTNQLYGVVGVCVCFLLLISVGCIFILMGSGGGSSGGGSSGGGDDCNDCDIPTNYTIQFKYADGVNPYNNFALPPFIPKPPEYFGKQMADSIGRSNYYGAIGNVQS